jgi:predicted nucleic acid-binding Zn ribbon protein
VEGTPADAGDRRCPVCSDPLRPRQQVCSGKCRAELSRRRQAEARQARGRQVRALLLAVLDLIGKDGQPRAATQVTVALSVQREVCYKTGCYHLQGDGVTVPYQWVWVPAAPAPPPPNR